MISTTRFNESGMNIVSPSGKIAASRLITHFTSFKLNWLELS